VDDGKHFCATDDPINLEVAGVEVDFFLDGLFVVVGVCEALVVGLVEAVDLVLHVFSQPVDFFLGQPLGMEVAPSLVFDEVFLLLGILSISSP
jgi:hypothetical protein